MSGNVGLDSSLLQQPGLDAIAVVYVSARSQNPYDVPVPKVLFAISTWTTVSQTSCYNPAVLSLHRWFPCQSL
ncbi:hypothetical protein SLA2020_393870 [Shorea laevis]